MVQNFIVRKVTERLSEKLDTEVSVARVNYKLFNTFSFEDLYIQDLNKDTLLFVHNAHADFDFFRFFSGKFIFKHVMLDRLEGNLVIDEAGVSNLDFIIRQFSKPEKDRKPSSVTFRFKDIQLINSSFRLYNLQHPASADSVRFDVNRMQYKDINAKITVNYLHGDSLVANLRSFSAKERSGLIVKNLETQVYGMKTGFRFPFFNLTMPNSQLLMDSVRMDYDSISGLKNMLNSVRWQSVVKPSVITLDDLSAFSPVFSGMKDPVNIRGKISGPISNFRIRDMELQYQNSIVLKANIDMNGIPDIDETFIYADVKDFMVNRGEAQDFVAKLTKKPFILPDEFSRLGTIRYRGNISGFFSNLVAYGNITTNVGNLKTDILLQLENQLHDVRYNGTVQSDNFRLDKLLANETLGKTAFSINTIGSKLHNKSLQGTITGTISEIYLNKYDYRDITLDGNYDGTGFEGELKIADPNLSADFNGIADFSQELPVFNFDLQVDNVDLYALHFTKRYEGSQLKFTANTKMTGNSLDNLNGYLLVDSVSFINAGKELSLNKLMFESAVDEGLSHFTVSSEIINGYLDGDFKYSAIPAIVTSILQSYIPALSGQNIVKNQLPAKGSNHMDIDLILNDTKQLSDVLELPVQLDGITTIRGFIDEASLILNLAVATPYVSFGNRTIQDVILNFGNEDEQLNITVSGKYNQNYSHLDFNLMANAADNMLHTRFDWNNNDTVVNAGELQFNTRFFKENNLSSALTTFLPTQIIVNDSVWDIHTSQIAFNPDSTIDIRNFRIQNKSQYIVIDGLASNNLNDMIQVEMNDIDLDFIMGMINLRSISINGQTTGTANIYGILKHPAFEANLIVKEANLNNAPVGDAYIYSSWDQEMRELLMSGTFLERNDTVAFANGFYSFKDDLIDIIFDANNLNLGFLQRYLKRIVQGLNARGTGSVRMSGPKGDIGFEGSVMVNGASMKVGFLNTTYSFADSIYMKRESINLKNIKIFDEERNQATLNGLIKHNGGFKNMIYDLKITARDILALNTKPADNDYFYGKAYTTGNVHIHGNEQTTYVDVNATTMPRTKMYISTGSASVANENDFITFANKEDSTVVSTTDLREQMDMYLTMQLDVTPDADIQLILSPHSADMISANGSGNLRLEYQTSSDLKLYGGYTIEKGNFLFTLQNLIRKQFRIDQGSSLTWSGNPERAQLDIRAIHSLTASLYDLMSDDILSSTDRTSVPVECILYLIDELTQPNISFDVNLPSSDETLKMQVRNLMNTQEMINRQMVYLLLFGKFYTPDYNRTVSDYASSTNTGISFLTSTLSGQINNWLSQISNNISLGVNYRSSGAGSTISQEYEGEIMYQPNNRFIINGNFGYRDDNLSKNKIIGDLDMEYILTENAKWRLKAYNHTVDRYSLRSAPFIQGVGIMYKESFNKWNELWRVYMKKSRKEKETDTDIQNNSLPSNINTDENTKDTIRTTGNAAY